MREIPAETSDCGGLLSMARRKNLLVRAKVLAAFYFVCLVASTTGIVICIQGMERPLDYFSKSLGYYIPLFGACLLAIGAVTVWGLLRYEAEQHRRLVAAQARAVKTATEHTSQMLELTSNLEQQAAIALGLEQQLDAERKAAKSTTAALCAVVRGLASLVDDSCSSMSATVTDSSARQDSSLASLLDSDADPSDESAFSSGVPLAIAQDASGRVVAAAAADPKAASADGGDDDEEPLVVGSSSAGDSANPLEESIQQADKAIAELESRIAAFRFLPPLEKQREEEDEEKDGKKEKSDDDDEEEEERQSKADEALAEEAAQGMEACRVVATVRSSLDSLRLVLVHEMERRTSLQQYLELMVRQNRELKNAVTLRDQRSAKRESEKDEYTDSLMRQLRNIEQHLETSTTNSREHINRLQAMLLELNAKNTEVVQKLSEANEANNSARLLQAELQRRLNQSEAFTAERNLQVHKLELERDRLQHLLGEKEALIQQLDEQNKYFAKTLSKQLAQISEMRKASFSLECQAMAHKNSYDTLVMHKQLLEQQLTQATETLQRQDIHSQSLEMRIDQLHDTLDRKTAEKIEQEAELRNQMHKVRQELAQEAADRRQAQAELDYANRLTKALLQAGQLTPTPVSTPQGSPVKPATPLSSSAAAAGGAAACTPTTPKEEEAVFSGVAAAISPAAASPETSTGTTEAEAEGEEDEEEREEGTPTKTGSALEDEQACQGVQDTNRVRFQFVGCRDFANNQQQSMWYQSSASECRNTHGSAATKADARAWNESSTKASVPHTNNSTPNQRESV